MQILLISYLMLIFVSSNAFELPFLFKQVAFLYPQDAVYMHAQLMGYYNIAQAVFIVIAGYLSDKYGKKIIFYACSLILVFAMLLQAFAYNIEILTIARILIAVRAGGIVIVFAAASEFPKEKRIKVMGFLSASFALAFIIFPYISGLIVGKIENTHVISTALFTNAGIVLTSLLAITYLKVSKTNKNVDLISFSSLKSLTKSIWIPVSILSAASFLMAGIETFMPPSVYQISKEGKNIGLAFSVLSLTMAVTELVSSWVLKLRARNIIIGFIVVSCGFLYYSYATNLTSVIVALFVISIGFGLVYPSSQALVSIISPKDKQGISFSIIHIFRVLSAALANFALAPAYNSFTNSASLVWLIYAFIALFAAVSSLILARRIKYS